MSERHVVTGLRESLELYRQVFLRSGDAILVVDPQEGTILEANPRACRLLGYAREALVALKMSDVQPDDLPALQSFVRSVFEQGTGDSDGFTWVGRSGRRVEVDVSAAVVGLGGLPCLLLMARSGADRRRALKARARLAAIVEATDDAIIGATLEGVITSWNPGAERLYGYPAEEVKGKHASILFPPDRLDELRAILDRVNRGERIESYRTLRLKKGGEAFVVMVGITPVKEASGRLLGISVIARGLTARTDFSYSAVSRKGADESPIAGG